MPDVLRSHAVDDDLIQYVVFYRPNDDGITVLMVVHGSRDVESMFRSRYPR